MSNETKEWILIVFAVIVLVVAAFFLATLPFALLGWILLSFGNMFGLGILTTYFNCAITGVVTALVAGLFTK